MCVCVCILSYLVSIFSFHLLSNLFIFVVTGKCYKTWMKGYCCKTCGGCQCGQGGGGGSASSGGSAPLAPYNPPSSGGSSGSLDATTLHWNSHRDCATARQDCIRKAQQSLASMARQAGAKIVGAVEFANSFDALPNWDTTGQQCDYSAIMVAPGWRITRKGGHCMGGDSNKGFAVAKVTPPRSVRGCPSLCVFMGHVPHPGARLDGYSEIASVCGGAERQCMIAMGDWNRADYDVHKAWSTLFGGSPSLIQPKRDATCCYNKYSLPYDHTATNIAGATSAGNKIFGYQLTQFPSGDEHKPTSVRLRLPTA